MTADERADDEPETTTGIRLALSYADVLAGWRGLASDIDDAIRAAVAEERAACAAVIQWFHDEPDGHDYWEWCDCVEMISAIRARQ